MIASTTTMTLNPQVSISSMICTTSLDSASADFITAIRRFSSAGILLSCMRPLSFCHDRVFDWRSIIHRLGFASALFANGAVRTLSSPTLRRKDLCVFLGVEENALLFNHWSRLGTPARLEFRSLFE